MALSILQSTQPEFTTGICCKGDSVSTAGLYKLSGFFENEYLAAPDGCPPNEYVYNQSCGRVIFINFRFL